SFCRAGRRPVRLLHARHLAHRRGPARGEPRAHAGRDPSRPGREPLSMHRLHQDPRRRRAGRLADESPGAGCGALSEAGIKKARFPVAGQSLPKIDAWAKVAGETKSADDLTLPRLAHGKLLRSPHPHALIKRIDTSRARSLPGVYGVITGHDLPRVK